MRAQRLTAPELDIFLRDLAEGPSARFRRIAVRRVPAEVSEARLRARLDEIVAGEPRIGWRVRRDDGGWHYEPGAFRPEPYVETHRLDGNCDVARRRLHLECHRPLDPVAGPLGRVSLLRYVTGGADLLVAVHVLAAGICSPWWLMRELAEVAVPQPVGVG